MIDNLHLPTIVYPELANDYVMHDSLHLPPRVVVTRLELQMCDSLIHISIKCKIKVNNFIWTLSKYNHLFIKKLCKYLHN